MAGFFMVIGILIMLGAGACSLSVLPGINSNGIGTVLIFGGIPFLMGALIVIVAKWASIATSQATSLSRPKKTPTNPDAPPPVNSFGFTPEDRKKD